MSQRVELAPGIVADAGVFGGKPIVDGRRVAVAQVLEHLAGGWTIEDVCREYELTAQQVRLCLSYAAGRIAAERMLAG